MSPENPTRTVFAIMVSSLHKKWSCISRLILCASITAEYLFPIIKSCILDIESCGLKLQIISTDNYPLNVNLFKLFAPSRRLETSVPHPSDNTRKGFVTFDFVHILKSIRNNWLNQKDIRRFNYLLTSFLQTDPLEHHFGLYLMMSGSNYHISYLQILETERRLKLSNILKIFASQQDFGLYSIQTFIESYSSLEIRIMAIKRMSNWF